MLFSRWQHLKILRQVSYFVKVFVKQSFTIHLQSSFSSSVFCIILHLTLEHSTWHYIIRYSEISFLFVATLNPKVGRQWRHTFGSRCKITPLLTWIILSIYASGLVYRLLAKETPQYERPKDGYMHWAPDRVFRFRSVLSNFYWYYVVLTTTQGLLNLLDERSSSSLQVVFPLIAGVGLGLLFHAPYQVFTKALQPHELATGTSAFFLVRFTGATIGLVSCYLFQPPYVSYLWHSLLRVLFSTAAWRTHCPPTIKRWAQDRQSI